MNSIVNKIDKDCNVCGTLVKSGEGLATEFHGEWYTYHKNCAPDGVKMPLEAKEQKKCMVVSNGRGQIFFPFNQAHVELVRTIPNRSWNRAESCWEFPLQNESKTRAIEVAKLIGLPISEEFEVKSVKIEKCKSYKNLYDYQKEGADFLYAKSAALLGDEMGTGKTVQALCALPSKARVLIVCPSTVKFNWVKEANTWRPDYRVTVLSASKTQTDYEATILVGKEKFRVPEENEIFILNREILPDFLLPKKKEGMQFPVCDLEEDFLKKLREVYIIVDEAHKFKGTKTAAHKKMKTLSRNSRSTWALTGTPLLNRPEDLWGVLSACNMEKIVFNRYGISPYDLFFQSFGGYQDRFGTKFTGPSSELPSLISRVRLARKRKDVLPQLPNKIYTNILVSLDGKDGSVIMKEMDELEKKYNKILNENALPPLTQFSRIRANIALNRIPAMLEYVEECEEQEVPIVVFSAHRSPIDILSTREGWAVIHGGISQSDRQKVVDAFQAGKLKGIGLTLDSGAEGITLTRAWKCLFVDLDWVPATNQQAEDRVCRIGQTSNKVEIVRFVANHPLDARLFKLLTEKEKLIKETFDGKNNVEPAPRPLLPVGKSYPEIVCDHESARAHTMPNYGEEEMETKMNIIINMQKEDYRYSFISQTDIKALKKLHDEFKDHQLYKKAVSFIVNRYDRLFHGIV